MKEQPGLMPDCSFIKGAYNIFMTFLFPTNLNNDTIIVLYNKDKFLLNHYSDKFRLKYLPNNEAIVNHFLGKNTQKSKGEFNNKMKRWRNYGT